MRAPLSVRHSSPLSALFRPPDLSSSLTLSITLLFIILIFPFPQSFSYLILSIPRLHPFPPASFPSRYCADYVFTPCPLLFRRLPPCSATCLSSATFPAPAGSVFHPCASRFPFPFPACGKRLPCGGSKEVSEAVQWCLSQRLQACFQPRPACSLSFPHRGKTG